MSRIYVASSWRNPHQPSIVDVLRRNGHDVYDFRNPPHSTGFGWSQIGLELPVSAVDYRNALLTHPRAAQGFMSDFSAMRAADTCLLVLPCGRSAHLELGWMAGAGKRTIILTQDGEEPELMALLADKICVDLDEVLVELNKGEAVKAIASAATVSASHFSTLGQDAILAVSNGRLRDEKNSRFDDVLVSVVGSIFPLFLKERMMRFFEANPSRQLTKPAFELALFYSLHQRWPDVSKTKAVEWLMHFIEIDFGEEGFDWSYSSAEKIAGEYAEAFAEKAA